LEAIMAGACVAKSFRDSVFDASRIGL